MIFEGDFFFHGMPRWNLGWPTPNYAGAFLVTVVCCFWAIRAKDRRFLAAGLVLEATLYLLIAKTYSRGALLALAAAAVFFVAALGLKRFFETRGVWALRAAALAACIVGSGFIGRISSGYTRADAAVGNRLSLWRGGLEMIASAPWSGWGAGESGRAYMNWFQPLGDTEVFTTMVNSYLHVAVEYGLFILCAALVFLFAVLMEAWRRAAQGDAWAAAAGASLLAWAVANVFTTLWIEPKLWIVPGLATAVIVWRSRRSSPGELAKIAVFAAAGAATVSCAFFGLGTISATRYSWKVIPQGADSTALLPRASINGNPSTWHVWADTTVFGPSPGQELRRWAEVQALELHVHRPSLRAVDEHASAGGLLLSGNQAERFWRDPIPGNVEQVWLLHPSVPPPSTAATPAGRKSLQLVVVLPGVDEAGLNAPWRSWAANVHARVVMTAGSGLDLRAAWPQAAPRRPSS